MRKELSVLDLLLFAFSDEAVSLEVLEKRKEAKV